MIVFSQDVCQTASLQSLQSRKLSCWEGRRYGPSAESAMEIQDWGWRWLQYAYVSMVIASWCNLWFVFCQRLSLQLQGRGWRSCTTLHSIFFKSSITSANQVLPSDMRGICRFLSCVHDVLMGQLVQPDANLILKFLSWWSCLHQFLWDVVYYVACVQDSRSSRIALW